MPTQPISIHMFGALRVVLADGSVLKPLGPHSGALLALLALEPERDFTREELTDFLWQDDEAEEGRRKLRQLAYGIRQQLKHAGYHGPDILHASRDTLRINSDVVAIDSRDFEGLAQRGDRARSAEDRAQLYRQATDLYCGDLLIGFYNDIFLSERRRLMDRCFGAFRSLSRALDEIGDLDQATAAARRATELNRTSEDAYRDVMRLYCRAGMPSAALLQYHELERALREELGVVPSPAMQELAASLRDADVVPQVPATRAEPFPDATPSAPRREPVTAPGSARRVAWPAAIPLVAAVGIALLWSRSARHQAVTTPVLPALPASSTVLWEHRLTPPRGYGDAEPSAVVVDPFGNVYIAGLVRSAAQDVNFLVLKLDPSGKLRWQREYNGPGNDLDRAYCVALDRAGNLYVTGDSDNGRGNGTTRLSGTDWATVKYEPDGVRSASWADEGFGPGVRRYNGPDNGEDRPRKLIVDDSGSIYVGGDSRTRQGAAWAVVKYDARGRRVWSRRSEGSGNLGIEFGDMVVTPDGRVCITGGSRIATPDSPEANVLTTCFASDGRKLWEDRWGVGNHADDRGRVILADRFHLYVIAEGRTGPGTLNHTRSGCVVLSYDSSGTLQWARGAASEKDQIDHVWAGQRAADGVLVLGAHHGRDGNRSRIVTKDGGGSPIWSYDYGYLAGDDGLMCIAAGAGMVYAAGALRNIWQDHGVSELDSVAVGVDGSGNPIREWVYRGSGDRMAPDRALAVAVRPPSPGVTGERLVVAGQSALGSRRDLVALCYPR